MYPNRDKRFWVYTSGKWRPSLIFHLTYLYLMPPESSRVQVAPLVQVGYMGWTVINIRHKIHTKIQIHQTTRNWMAEGYTIALCEFWKESKVLEVKTNRVGAVTFPLTFRGLIPVRSMNWLHKVECCMQSIAYRQALQPTACSVHGLHVSISFI